MSDTTVKNAKVAAGATLSTQTYLRISEIRDNCLILKNGGIRSVLKVNSINFNLKSEDEQNSIIYSYQGFLNTLEEPIQIVIRSKKLDLDNYINLLKEKAGRQTNALLQKQTTEYVDYIQKLVEYADIMEKEFFVIVPQDSIIHTEQKGFLNKWFKFINAKDSYGEIKQRRQEFEELKKKLGQKVSSVKIGLENCGLKVEELNTKDLIELFYKAYNPNISKFQKSENFDQTSLKLEENIVAEDTAMDLDNTQSASTKEKKEIIEGKTPGNTAK